MSPLKIGRMAEEMSAAQDEAQGYVCDFKPLSKWGSKDLLATETKNGFDRVCTKHNELTRWTQCKSINKVTQEVLRDMIQWASDFTVDNVPSALVYLDVWWWKDPDGVKDKSNIIMERWGLPKMMGELGQREFAAAQAKERRDAREKALVEEMVEAIVPVEGVDTSPVISREEDFVSEEKELNGVQDVIDSVVKSAEEAKATAEKNMLIKEIDIEKLPMDLEPIEKPEGNVETFIMGFTPKDDKEKVKKDVQEGMDVMLIKGEENESS